MDTGRRSQSPPPGSAPEEPAHRSVAWSLALPRIVELVLAGLNRVRAESEPAASGFGDPETPGAPLQHQL